MNGETDEGFFLTNSQTQSTLPTYSVSPLFGSSVRLFPEYSLHRHPHRHCHLFQCPNRNRCLAVFDAAHLAGG